VLQIKNATPFKAMIMLLPDAAGIDTLYTVVKATFRLGDPESPADEQVPVVMADQHFADPATSSIRAPSDVGLGKPGTDVLLVGTAWAPDARPTWQMDVSVTVGPLGRTVRVFGDRLWDSRSGVAAMSWVAPFTRMPLVWERAYGGADETERGPSAEPRNPVGTGFRAAKGTRAIDGLRVANLEHPNSLISGPGDRPAPAGFAPIAPHWSPRLSFAGTYDEAWQAARAPYLPDDFDARFFHVAPNGLSSATPLQGGEPVELRGVTRGGLVQFTLPRRRVRVDHRLDHGVETRFGALETVLFEPDAGRFVMVWRAALPCDKRALKVREVRTSVLVA
jgi:hypothetical protein